MVNPFINEVKITGVVGSGKSTILYYLNKVLIENGFAIKYTSEAQKYLQGINEEDVLRLDSFDKKHHEVYIDLEAIDPNEVTKIEVENARQKFLDSLKEKYNG